MKKKFFAALLIASSQSFAAYGQLNFGLDEGFVTITTAEEIEMSGLNLKSAGGLFVPIPPGDTTAPADPFTFLLANNSSNVSFAAIPGNTVTISGRLVTGVGYTGDSAGQAVDMAASAFSNADFQQSICVPILIDHLYGSVSGNHCSDDLVDFGQVRWGDDTAGRLADQIHVHNFGGPFDVTGFSLSSSQAATAFLIPDFTVFRLEGEGDVESFDVELNTRLPPGVYEASISFSAELLWDAPVGEFPESHSYELFQFRAEIVPAPCVDSVVALCLLGVLGLRRPRSSLHLDGVSASSRKH